ncbi:tyrosine-type recombinase/integrase [Dokdonia sp. Dokd-P16]|uniref:tyrosine-type recombinase/integrase n=1 Tax=Dokdonia sp. Dokd-P16 TaxID=2173169 RepID=UPI00194EBC79|nr:site-specific integrase [Dokdonia sp. Dokd-P16]
MLKIVKSAIENLLEAGYNPFVDNKSVKEYLQSQEKEKIGQAINATVTSVIQQSNPVLQVDNAIQMSIKDAFQLGLETKQRILNENSFPKFKSRIKRFEVWLSDNSYTEENCITTIQKKSVIQYLNSVLQLTSARNRNNTRTAISSLFQVLEDNDVVQENFVKKINVLKSVPERNKTYTPKQVEDVFHYMKVNDPILLLFVQFISYNFLRPIEVCRLRIGDLDLKDKKLYVRAKNQPVKTKIIPDILLDKLSGLEKLDSNALLFTPDRIGGLWEAKEGNRSGHFSKRFKTVKDHFSLGTDYGLYSFRHTFITKLYKKLAIKLTPNEVKSKLMLITGHSTMKALEQYLRDIDAVLPQDYSNMLK